MKARIAFIALALFSAQASAEWELVSRGADGTEYFMDFSTKRQQGNYILVWGKSELPKGNLAFGKRYYSTKQLAVYDCAGFRYGHKAAVLYSEKATQGEIVYSFSVEMYEVVFTDVVPGSMAGTQFNLGCGKG